MYACVSITFCLALVSAYEERNVIGGGGGGMLETGSDAVALDEVTAGVDLTGISLAE